MQHPGRRSCAPVPAVFAAVVGRPVSTVSEMLRSTGCSRFDRPQRNRRVRPAARGGRCENDVMPRYQITLAPPPQGENGETWTESSARTLSVGDDVLASGRWVRLMREDATPAGFDGAFVAASAVPVGGITVGERQLDVYREDAKALLTKLAGDPARPGADEAMTMLEHMIRGEDASTDVGDDGVEAIIAAADAAITDGTASAPLIRLRATLGSMSA